MSTTTTLTKGEQTLLTKLESEIEQGINAFIRVGSALARIKRENLFTDYGTFDDYLRKRFPDSLKPVRRQIRLYDVATRAEQAGLRIDDIGYGHVTELAKVDDDDLPEVVEAVLNRTADRPKPRVKDIKEVVESALSPAHAAPTPPAAEPPPNPAFEDMPATLQLGDEPETGHGAAPPPPITIESFLTDYDEIARHLSQVKVLLGNMSGEDNPQAYYLGMVVDRALAYIKDLESCLWGVTPKALCAACLGHGCPICYHTGFIHNLIALKAKR